jgi:HK97 family phage portal protein
MRALLAHTLQRIARWLAPKTVPASLTGGQWSGPTFLDAYRRQRNPTPNELLAELKNTAFTCASINAAVCAAHPPKLYVATHDATQPLPRCLCQALDRRTEHRLRHSPTLPPRLAKAARLEEVLEHPLLTLLRQVNPAHNAFDLWELTTLYQEVHGSAYWYLALGPLGVPEEIWVLPSQNVTPRRRPDSRQLVDYYEYRNGATQQRFRPREVIHFRYPDPRDPYTTGLSPLKAAYENVALTSDYLAFKKATWENCAIPSAIISPAEVLGEEERDRLEAQWNQKYRRGGAGRVLVADSSLKVDILAHSMGDLAALAEYRLTKEDIANAFHIPLSFLTSETNLANLQAAEYQHLAKAIGPRLQRRDEKLNEQLVPLYDPTGRLFFASHAPLPIDPDASRQQQELDLKYGIVTINEVRSERGLPPVPWGDVPWLPLQWARTDYTGRADWDPPEIGRNRPKKN